MSTSSSTRIGRTRQSTTDTPLGLKGWSRRPNPSRSRRLCSPVSCESLPIQRSFSQQLRSQRPVECPRAVLVMPSRTHWDLFLKLCNGIEGPLVTDAYVAALAIQHG